MNFSYFLAKRTTYQSHRTFSRVIIRLSLIAVVLSIAIMIISDAIVIGFQGEIKNKISGFASHIQISKVRTSFGVENEPITYSDTLVRQIEKIPEVTHVQTFATKAGIVQKDSVAEGIVLKGVDKNYNWDFFRSQMVEGRPIHFSDSEKSKEIVVSKYLADKMGLKLGDELKTFFIRNSQSNRGDARLYNIVGIYQTSIEEIDKVFILADLRDVRKLNKGWKPDDIGGYEVFVSDFDKMDAVDNQIRFLKAMHVDQDTKTIQERYPQIFDWLNLLNVNIEIILTLMALVAAINMVTALIIMILERTQMIGILKALGASDWRVQKIFLSNSMILISVGILSGTLLSIILLILQKYFHIMKLNEQEYYLSEVPVYFSWLHILLIDACAFAFCTLCMILPSMLVVRIRPVKAIRFE